MTQPPWILGLTANPSVHLVIQRTDMLDEQEPRNQNWASIGSEMRPTSTRLTVSRGSCILFYTISIFELSR